MRTRCGERPLTRLWTNPRVARAQGASPADATVAAEVALAPTVTELQDAAFALLDVLIAVGGDEEEQAG